MWVSTSLIWLRAAKNTKRNWVAPSCFLRDAPVVTRRQCYIFFLQYPNLGSIKIAITFKFSVSHITLRTTKLSPLTQQARTEENYRYDKQDVNMNSFVRLNFWNLFHFSQFSFLLIHLSNFRAQWIIFSSICVAVISFRATKLQHHFFFLHNFTKYNLEIVVVLFPCLPDTSPYSWQYISIELHLL